jgi:hypothetical protein
METSNTEGEEIQPEIQPAPSVTLQYRGFNDEFIWQGTKFIKGVPLAVAVDIVEAIKQSVYWDNFIEGV